MPHVDQGIAARPSMTTAHVAPAARVDAATPGAPVTVAAACDDRHADAWQAAGAAPPATLPSSATGQPRQGGSPLACRCGDVAIARPADQGPTGQGPVDQVDPCPTEPKAPPPIRAGAAWGDVIERPTPQVRIDPVWFTFEGVIPDDRATIEVRGTDGAWRELPALLSRAEQQQGGAWQFILQTSIKEAEGLMLQPNKATAFRIKSPEGGTSKETPDVVFNDPTNRLSRVSFRPMEDRFGGDNHFRDPVFIPVLAKVAPADLDRAVAGATLTADHDGLTLTLPPGALDPGVVLETHPPVYASGHGVRAALAYPGTNETRANPDGSLTMRIPGAGPQVLRARHASTGGAPIAVALLDRGQLIPWSTSPFAFLADQGRFSLAGYASGVRHADIALSADKARIEAGPGTIPPASFLAVHNVSAKGIRWHAAAHPRVDVRPDGSFSIDVRDPKFGNLRVNDQITFVIGPTVQGIDDALVVTMTYDGDNLVPRQHTSSLAGARKAGYDVAPKG